MPAKDKEKERQRKKKYYQENKEHIRFQQNQYRKANLKKFANYQKEFRQRFPWKAIISNSKRRASRKGNGFEFYTIDQVIFKYGTQCHLCNKEIDFKAPRKQGKKGWEHGLHLDHVVPISKGGSDTIDNIRPAHGQCNLRKGVKG